jgi:hypothetical protein
MKQLSEEFKNYSLSWGTMRTEDLIPCFMNFLDSIKDDCQIANEFEEIQKDVEKLVIETLKGYGNYYCEKDRIPEFGISSAELASYILNEDIWELLNKISPENCCFTSHPGDGTDFGFWEFEEDDYF